MSKAGWNYIAGATKWHWFEVDGRSLCRRWLIMGNNEDAEVEDKVSFDNCKSCWKQRMAKLQRILGTPGGRTT